MKYKVLFLAAMTLLGPPAAAQAQKLGNSSVGTLFYFSRGTPAPIIEAAIIYTRDIAKSRMAVVVLDNAGHLVSSDAWMALRSI